jgi:hypothetical protein
MRFLLSAAALVCITAQAQVQCVGSGAFRTCTDLQNGNTYNVQKFGNTTTMQGSNPNGSQWSQTSQSIGNMNITNGTAANGQRWNETQINMGGGMVTRYGTDANGRPFMQTCTQFGCN